MPEKIREMVPLIDAAIQKLVRMSADAAKLEYSNNDEASRRIKRDLVEFKNTELANIDTAIKEVRTQNNSNKQKRRDERKSEQPGA